MTKNRTRNRLIINSLALIVTLGVNGAANALPIGGKTTGEVSAAYPNLFTPAPVTFSIWGVIYLALLGFVLYQWRVYAATGDAPATQVIGPLFWVSGLFNGAWLIAWHYEHIGLSLVFMVGLLLSLIGIYLKLQTGRRRLLQPEERWFVLAPFGLYLGWISVATIANVSVLLVSVGFRGGPFSELTWTLLVLAVALGLGLVFLFLRKDPFPTLVFAWAFAGIALRHGCDSVLGIAASIAAVLLVLSTVVQWIRGRLL